MIRVLVLAILLVLAHRPAFASSLQAACAAIIDDDSIHLYQPDRDDQSKLRDGTVRGFHTLFPGVRQLPAGTQLLDQARYRCMGGRVYACFIGANLPCDRIRAARDNPGATAFCRDNPDSSFVPMFATGHDALFAYRCRQGQALTVRQIFHLDRRGFARELWTPISGG